MGSEYGKVGPYIEIYMVFGIFNLPYSSDVAGVEGAGGGYDAER
jgi:hypothetical protein